LEALGDVINSDEFQDYSTIALDADIKIREERNMQKVTRIAIRNKKAGKEQG